MTVLTDGSVTPGFAPEKTTRPGESEIAVGGLGFPPVADIRVRVLGRFAVVRRTQEIPARAFGGRRAQQLLRLLALQRGTLVLKDVIAEALWPQQPPVNAGGNIEVLVSRIRRALGDRTLIQTSCGGYSLAAGGRCWVDAEAFLGAVEAGRRLLVERSADALVSFRNALELWNGEPLAEDIYSEWAQEHRRRLALAHVEALEGAATAALLTGEPADAVTWAQRALASEALRESSAMIAVRALAASGNRAEALVAFDSFRRTLADEAGLDPSPEALELRQHILLGQPVAPAPASKAARPTARLPEPLRFVGREEECAAVLSAAAGVGPRLIMVTGPSGVGKSRLLAEATRRTQVPVLSCQAFPADRNVAWSLAESLLRQAGSVAGPAGVMLPDREAQALAALIPGAKPINHNIPSDEPDRAFAVQGAVRLVEAVAQPRCLIMVDDLQWADPTSVELLGLLLRRTDRVSMVAALQQESAPAVAPECFGMPAAQVQHLPLGPLPATAIRTLFSDTVLAEVILDEADHTPLMVIEVAAALAVDGTVVRDQQGDFRLPTPSDPAHARKAVRAGLHHAVLGRLARLPARWRELLTLVALVGRPAQPALLADATGWDPCEIANYLDGLARAGLVTPGPDGWRPGHELFSQALAGRLRPAERASTHALLAKALQQHGGGTAEIAAHLAASGDRDRASAAYAAAAARCLGQRSDDEALRLAEAGLSLGPSGPAGAQLLQTRAEAYRRRGKLKEARADLKAALESCDDAAGRSGLLAELAILEARSVSIYRGEELVELAIAEAHGQPGALGQALAAGAIIDLPAGNLARARRRFQRARQLLEEAGEVRGCARLLYWQAMTSYTAGRLREAATRLRDLAHLPALPVEVLRLWSPRATRGHVLALLGQPEAGLTEIDETLAQAGTARYLAVEAECLWRRSEALVFAGRSGEAVEQAEQAVFVATQLSHAGCTAGALRGLGIAWEAAGKLDRAEEAFRCSRITAEGNTLFAAWASARLGACLARQGRPRDAAPHVRDALATGPPLSRYEARWAHAELLAARGEDIACQAAAAAALQAAQKGGYLVLVPRLSELAVP